MNRGFKFFTLMMSALLGVISLSNDVDARPSRSKAAKTTKTSHQAKDERWKKRHHQKAAEHHKLAAHHHQMAMKTSGEERKRHEAAAHHHRKAAEHHHKAMHATGADRTKHEMLAAKHRQAAHHHGQAAEHHGFGRENPHMKGHHQNQVKHHEEEARRHEADIADLIAQDGGETDSDDGNGAYLNENGNDATAEGAGDAEGAAVGEEE